MDHKKVLKAISRELRHLLEGEYDEHDKWRPGDLEQRLAALGVWRHQSPKPVEQVPLSEVDRAARLVVDRYVAYRAEAGVLLRDAVAEFVRESAFTWANRLIALRCMEARGIITDPIVLQSPAYAGRSLEHHRLLTRRP